MNRTNESWTNEQQTTSAKVRRPPEEDNQSLTGRGIPEQL